MIESIQNSTVIYFMPEARLERAQRRGAPGFAPSFDVCGMAGGTYPHDQGPGAAVFYDTAIAKRGDLWSKVLPKGEATAVWKAGSTVEVSWGIRYK